MNPFDIRVPCTDIAKSEILFEQYRMDLNWNKYDIEVQNDDAINRNRIFFDFMPRKFSSLDGLYMDEKKLIDTIKEDQLRYQSAAEVEILNKEKGQKQRKIRYI